jgi:hypothetical protein
LTGPARSSRSSTWWRMPRRSSIATQLMTGPARDRPARPEGGDLPSAPAGPARCRCAGSPRGCRRAAGPWRPPTSGRRPRNARGVLLADPGGPRFRSSRRRGGDRTGLRFSRAGRPARPVRARPARADAPSSPASTGPRCRRGRSRPRPPGRRVEGEGVDPTTPSAAWSRRTAQHLVPPAVRWRALPEVVRARTQPHGLPPAHRSARRSSAVTMAIAAKTLSRVR